VEKRGVAARWCRQGGEASNNEEEEPRKGAAARCRVDAEQKGEVERVRERGGGVATSQRGEAAEEGEWRPRDARMMHRCEETPPPTA
jgi:hypothetical protein